MKFNSARVDTIWKGKVLTTWTETFINVKRNSTKLKGIVSHDEGKWNANYPKMSRITHKIGEKMVMNM